MVRCSVLQCFNKSCDNNLGTDGVSYHSFPCEAVRRTKWIRATGRRNWQPTASNYICSDHFEFTGPNIDGSKKKHIKLVAVPTKNITVFHKTLDEFEANNIKEPDNNETIEYIEQHNNLKDTLQDCLESKPSDKQTGVETRKDPFPTLQELKLTAQLRWTKCKAEEQDIQLKKIEKEAAILKRKMTAVEGLVQAKKANLLSNDDIVNLLVKQLDEIDKDTCS